MYCSVHEGNPAAGTCVRCGKPVCQTCMKTRDGRILCEGCAAIPTTDKNRIVAGVLALLLGPLGIHKFYLGRTGLGVLYLLCGTIGAFLVIPTLIIAIISFVEGLILLFMSDEQFARKYGTTA